MRLEHFFMINRFLYKNCVISEYMGNYNPKIIGINGIEDAKKEIALWFKKEEMHSYKTVHETHTL